MVDLPSGHMEEEINVHKSRKTTIVEKLQIFSIGASGVVGFLIVVLSILIWVDVVKLNIEGLSKHVIPSILLSIGVLIPFTFFCICFLIPFTLKKAKPAVVKGLGSKLRKPKSRPYFSFKDADIDTPN
jgi:protein-S-isoprenylcysteine O-methyltransferase Ste14